MPNGHDPEKLKKAIDDAGKLVEQLERSKVPVPPAIKQIVSAMKEGKEIAMSAEEASRHFAKFIKDLDAQCGLNEDPGAMTPIYAWRNGKPPTARSATGAA